MSEALVSIIVRTCGRPKVLANALDSIRIQTYPDIEVIVVEDGSNKSENYIRENYADLQLKYCYTEKKVGRCRAGNIGLEMANGKYCNFLDDDDIFLPDHVAILVNEQKKTNCRVAYSIAEEQQIRFVDASQHLFKVKRSLIRYKQPFNRLLLCYMNYLPIQSVMFERALFKEQGGFDEKMDVLEDWDLWLRYSLTSDFQYVPQITSIYYTPYKSNKRRTRDINLKQAEQAVIEKHQQYQIVMDAEKVNREMDYIVNVFNKKGLFFYAKKIRNYLLYRDF